MDKSQEILMHYEFNRNSTYPKLPYWGHLMSNHHRFDRNSFWTRNFKDFPIVTNLAKCPPFFLLTKHACCRLHNRELNLPHG